jgi:hypothetical protein
VPAETFTEETFPDYGIGMNEIEEEDPGDDRENPKDDLGSDVNISWATTQSGLVTGPGGWEFEPGGLTIRFNIQDSTSCGGSNPNNNQAGQATATITTTRRLFLGLELTGAIRSEFTDYDVMTISFNGQEIRRASSDTDKSPADRCIMFPPVQEELVSGPFVLPAGSTNVLLLDYVADNSSHRGAFYQCTLRFLTEPTGRPA